MERNLTKKGIGKGESMSEYLLISDAAKEVQVESHVLRYWEEELHLPIKRNELGHRFYTREDVERFRQIKSMKERGLQLKAIKMILKEGRLDLISGLDESWVKESAGEKKEDAATVQEKGDKKQMGEADWPEGEHRKQSKHIDRQAEVSGGRMESAGGQQGEPRAEREADPAVRMGIEILESRDLQEVSKPGPEDRSRRLQWILRQMMQEAVKENNEELCRSIKESVIKELDYQFRMQEERQEERDKENLQRSEEYYRRIDVLLRQRSSGRRLRGQDLFSKGVGPEPKDNKENKENRKKEKTRGLKAIGDSTAEKAKEAGEPGKDKSGKEKPGKDKPCKENPAHTVGGTKPENVEKKTFFHFWTSGRKTV